MSTHHYTLLAALFVLLPAGERTYGMDDLERALKAEQEALDSLKVELETDRKRLERKSVQRQSVTEALNRSEREVLQIRGELRNLARREKVLAGRVGATREELAAVEGRLRAREDGMALRLREIYKLARGGKMQVLFSGDSFADAPRRLKYLSSIARQDQRDYHSIREDRRRISKVLALHRAQFGHQRRLIEGKRERGTAFRQRMTEHTRNLDQLRADEVSMAQAIKEREKALARAEEKFKRLIQEMETRRRLGQRLAELPAFDFAAHQGRLPAPVEGKVIASYGRQQNAKLKTWTFNRGINLAAPEGTEVKAVAPGEVVLIDWFPGYGQFVLLRHPGGFYSLYGHLSRVLAGDGDILAGGAAVGAVGDTGRLDGIPQLHFEIMRGEDPLDPAAWLVIQN